MRLVSGLLALIGLVAIIAVGYAAWTFREFDPKAGSVYWNMAKRLAETGNAVEATVWRRKVEDGLSFEEVEESIKSVAATENIRAVGELPLGRQALGWQQQTGVDLPAEQVNGKSMGRLRLDLSQPPEH